jgi:hypothetical protein
MAIRNMNVDSVAVTNDATTTQRIGFTGARGGGYIVTSLTTAVSVTYLVSHTLGGTMGDLRDSANAVITQTLTAGDAYEIPTEAFAFAEVAFLADAGSAVLEVVFKS